MAELAQCSICGATALDLDGLEEYMICSSCAVEDLDDDPGYEDPDDYAGMGWVGKDGRP